MAAVLRDAAIGIADAQACLKAAEDLADRHQLALGPDGAVASRHPAAAPGIAAGFIQAASAAEAEVSALVQRALSVAAETDAQITARLREIGLFEGTATGNLADARAELAAAGRLAAVLDQSAVPPEGTDPVAVNAWWRALSGADQQRLIAELPARIGWLDGLPATARSAANVLAMERAKGALTARLRSLEKREPPPDTVVSGPPPIPAPNPAWGAWNAEVSEVKDKLAQIATLENGLASAEQVTGQRAFLLGFNPDGIGHAILAVGNPDTATNTVTYVPGLGSHVSAAGGDINRAITMWRNATHYAAPSQKISSIYWLNYNAPQWSGLQHVAGTGDATAGAANLAGFQSGLGAAHQPGVPDRTTVIGHSYGSLVVGEAAADDRMKPSDIIFVGSPGVGVDHASQLGTSPAHVWAGANEHDPVPYTQWFGDNPATRSFGAQDFDANQDPGRSFWGPMDPRAHSDYWDANSSSLFNMAHIAVGNYGPVTRAH